MNGVNLSGFDLMSGLSFPSNFVIKFPVKKIITVSQE